MWSILYNSQYIQSSFPFLYLTLVSLRASSSIIVTIIIYNHIVWCWANKISVYLKVVVFFSYTVSCVCFVLFSLIVTYSLPITALPGELLCCNVCC